MTCIGTLKARSLPIISALLLAVLNTPATANVISPNSFNLWGTCGSPYLGSGGVIVPEGGSNCSVNMYGAVQNYAQQAGGFNYYGCFKGGSNAPSSSNEEAVFLTDDINNWTGHEFGFVKTLNDNSLKAYLQGGGNYITRVLSNGDNGYHTFQCQCQSGDHSKVDFYVDGVYKFTLQNPGSSYWYNWDYFVGTTHRTSGGWSSTGQQIEMYSMNVW